MVAVYPFLQIVSSRLFSVTRGSVTPGVQIGSGRPFLLSQRVGVWGGGVEDATVGVAVGIERRGGLG